MGGTCRNMVPVFDHACSAPARGTASSKPGIDWWRLAGIHCGRQEKEARVRRGSQIQGFSIAPFENYGWPRGLQWRVATQCPSLDEAAGSGRSFGRVAHIPFVPRRVFRRIPTRYIASAATLGPQRNVFSSWGLPPPLLICIKAGALLQP